MEFFEQYGLLILFTLFLGFVLFSTVLRSKRYNEQVKLLLANLKKGDYIVTVGGIYGTVVDMPVLTSNVENIAEEKSVLIETGYEGKTSYTQVNIRAIQSVVNELKAKPAKKAPAKKATTAKKAPAKKLAEKK